ncbi:MAG: flagellar basal-body MS-ring/collar protein FliF [Formivibrio sp.]|nr:flagellar basal-body MS-ring/collar protein FliF [Formivibrio sp.]
MAEAGVTAQRNPVADKGIGGVRQRLEGLSGPSKLGLMVIAALAIALLAGALLWSREPAWRILFTNVPDKDGGAIIQSLQQMNVPYKLDAGGTIQVPADKVYDARLRLADQGLPKAGNVGFELMDSQKFGISQFAEQVNYQRAIEGELARSIETISVVERARVHLAIPKQTVFLRDQQKPTASIVLTLQRGRQLDAGQVAGIVHLVSSSVPDLQVNNVTLVDQNGDLLSRGRDNMRTTLDPNQLQYVQQVEGGFVDRIQAILSPIVGRNNVRAEVTAQVDFAEVEETSEKFQPNNPPNAAAIRSQQTTEQVGSSSNDAAAGIPGALSNQPPGAAAAPITATASKASTVAADGTSNTSSNSRREGTTNYELDKTIQHVKQAVGGVKRLSVAVVVNYKASKNADGQQVFAPMTPQEMGQISDLVREAVGFNASRGDSVNVVNAAFTQPAPEEERALPDRTVDYLKANFTDVMKMALIAIVVIYLLFFVVRPLMKDMTRSREEGRTLVLEEGQGDGEPINPFAAARAAANEEGQERMSAFADLLQRAKELAKNDPRMVATILREWMIGEEETSDSNKRN